MEYDRRHITTTTDSYMTGIGACTGATAHYGRKNLHDSAGIDITSTVP